MCPGSYKLLTPSLRPELLGIPGLVGSWERYRVILVIKPHLTLIFLDCSSGDEQWDSTLIKDVCIPVRENNHTLQEVPSRQAPVEEDIWSTSGHTMPRAQPEE